MKSVYILCIVVLINFPAFPGDNIQPPGLLLANSYRQNIHLSDYWVSEKLDGVRAYWNGKQLISRQGNVYHAPAWFTDVLPAAELDGELWSGRGTFDELSAIVRRQSPKASDWSSIQYKVFDLPASEDVFDQRLIQLGKIIRGINAPHVKAVEQFKLPDHQALMKQLDKIASQGGEGLMLHRGSSLYKNTRSDDLLKVKHYQDAEATVIAHLPGKGKYSGLLGSIEVKTTDHRRFKIGTGFSDAERKNPPAVGSVITYKYFGLTNKGTPRFASFVRVREDF